MRGASSVFASLCAFLLIGLFLFKGHSFYSQPAVRPLRYDDLAQLPSKSANSNKILHLDRLTYEDLVSLPQIGPVLAQKILQYQSDVGFRQVDDLLKVKGIGDKTYQKIKAYFTLD